VQQHHPIAGQRRHPVIASRDDRATPSRGIGVTP
jgi:hypothetical protein